MRWMAIALCYSGLLSLCLAMSKHHKQVLQRDAAPAMRHVLTGIGWAGIVGSFATSVWVEGWSFGSVEWVAQLAVTGMLLVFMLPYVPRAAVAVGLLSLVCAFALLFW